MGHSRSGGTEGPLYIFATFNLWNDERNVNVNRNDNDWNDNWWFAGVRNSLISLSQRESFLIRARSKIV